MIISTPRFRSLFGEFDHSKRSQDTVMQWKASKPQGPRQSAKICFTFTFNLKRSVSVTANSKIIYAPLNPDHPDRSLKPDDKTPPSSKRQILGCFELNILTALDPKATSTQSHNNDRYSQIHVCQPNAPTATQAPSRRRRSL